MFASTSTVQVLVLQDLQSLGHVGHVNGHAYVPTALPEWLVFVPRSQAGAGQFVHSLAEPKMPLPAQALRRGGNVRVEVDSRAHTLRLASRCAIDCITDAAGRPRPPVLLASSMLRNAG